MEEVKKGKNENREPAKKDNALKKDGGVLSDAELGKVTGGGKSFTEFNPQPDPPGRQ